MKKSFWINKKEYFLNSILPLIIIGIILFIKHNDYYKYVLYFVLLQIILLFIYEKSLNIVKFVFEFLIKILKYIITFILVFFIHIIIFSIIHFVGFVLRKQFLNIKIKDKKSYFVKRNNDWKKSIYFPY